MAKFHVNPNTGNSGTCKSTKGKCPFGSEEEHFDNAQDATNATEKLMAENHSTVNAAYRKKDNSALEGMNREMKKRIISEAASGANGLHPSVVAKVFSKDNDELIRKNVSENFKSQKILKEMSNDKSARVRLAVAKATNNPEVLKTFSKDPDSKVRNAALENKNIPVKVRKATLDAIKKQRAENLKKNLADTGINPIAPDRLARNEASNKGITDSINKKSEIKSSQPTKEDPVQEAENKLKEISSEVEELEKSRQKALAYLKESTDTIKSIEADREKLKVKYSHYAYDDETVAQFVTRQRETRKLDNEYESAIDQRAEARSNLSFIREEKAAADKSLRAKRLALGKSRGAAETSNTEGAPVKEIKWLD